MRHQQHLFKLNVLEEFATERKTIIGRLDDSTRALQPAFEFSFSWDGGAMLAPPRLQISPFPDSGHAWATTRATRGDCVSPTSIRTAFDTSPFLTLNDCFIATAEARDGETFVVLGSDGRIGRLEAGSLEIEPTSRGVCKYAFEQPDAVLDVACQTQFLEPAVTILRANATTTNPLSAFTLPDGHVLVALIRAEPRLIVTGTKEDGGFAVHACNETECKRLGQTSSWPPVIGATSETLSFAHYEPDAGIFVWRHRRSTLGL